jgi:predicted unusual protein kinase regulating ubiquinone biosynthesis (AarF/ABC1/UbiB family)
VDEAASTTAQVDSHGGGWRRGDADPRRSAGIGPGSTLSVHVGPIPGHGRSADPQAPYQIPMTEADDQRLQQFRQLLRQQSKGGSSRGLRRVARAVRGGAGLAKSMLHSTGRGPNLTLSEGDLRRFEALVTRLGELKGLPMKFGQVMSYLELELPEEARRLLGLLQTQSPATPFEQIAEVVREDLGARAAPLLAGLSQPAVSIASIGQVHRGQLPDSTPVAVKVRHPDIEAIIRSDFRAARLGTALAATILPGMGLTTREFVSELRARLLEECDYALEAERQQLFASLYADHPMLIVPRVYPDWCGPRVLTSRWEAGSDFETFCGKASRTERDQAGAALFDFYLGTLYRCGTFHADPHPGNYHFRADGRVIVFDYGCVRVFEAEAVQAFVALAEAVRADDRARVCAALRALGAEPCANDASYAHLRRLLRSFFGPMLLAGRRRIDGRIVIDMRQVTRDKLAIMRLRLPGKFMFLFRIRFGLYAVLSRLGSVCDWAAMERRFAEAAVRTDSKPG